MLNSSSTPLRVMSHAVVGYPNLEENEHAIRALVHAGITLIELQVPFSDPVADGATLLNACHHALQQGGSVASTLALCSKVAKQYPQVRFILMSYLNPLYCYGLEKLFTDAAQAGFQGIIIPDMPVEQIEPYLPLLDQLHLAPILMIAPNTSEERLARIARSARSMLYVVSRLGVTGAQTHQWNAQFQAYIARIRQYSDLPLAVGFGVRSAADLRALNGVVEVAAFCSQYIDWQTQYGSDYAAQQLHHTMQAAALI